MRILSWNINSVRRRLDQVARLVDEARPDVVCLQETKVTDAQFPHQAMAALGFPHRAVHGMPGYNGVAILSRRPFDDAVPIPRSGRADGRHIRVRFGTVEVHCLYIPAGGDLPDPDRNPKFARKLAFLDELADWFAGCYGWNDRLVLAGDFNVAPLETDVWNHLRMKRVVTHTAEEISRLVRLQSSLRWEDAIRLFVPADEHLYTWWSYRTADWKAAGKGRRLDHLWVTRPLVPSVRRAEVLADVRNWLPPSDHVPVLVEVDDGVAGPS